MRLLLDEVVFPCVARPDFVAPGVRDDLLRDADCGPPLRVYVALTDGRLGADLGPADRWRNRYYWFLRFANLHRRKFGFDAGIEDQASQVLAEVDAVDVDPSELEELDAAARSAC